ncbi:MAG: hypothetical protein ACLUDU_07490 [Butyricimonas faecihominis]
MNEEFVLTEAQTGLYGWRDAHSMGSIRYGEVFEGLDVVDKIAA